MHRHRGRPRREDIEFREHMMERDLAYEHEYRRRMYDYYYADKYHDLEVFDDEFEEYDFAYRLRMYELERAERLRAWEEWEMAHRERLLMEDRGYPHERLPMAIADEDEMLPFPPAEERLPPPPRFYAPEHFPAPEEQGNEGQQSWSPKGSWMNAQDESWDTGRGLGQGIGGYPIARQKDDQDHDEDKGEMEVEDEDDDKTKEEKQIFKLKHYATIPLCYATPHFDSKFSEFTITVSPIVYLDTVKPCFISITANASSVRINMGIKKDGVMTNSLLVLMAKASSMKNLMRGILMQNYFSETLTISVEQRKAEESSDETATGTGSVSYPTVIHKASFRINNKAIRDHMNCITIPDDKSSEKQSALSLHNLPKSVDWTFLQNLFPLSLNGQVIEGEPRSALIQMRSPKMALIHVASITGLQIHGQYARMRTDVPSTEAIQMLREVKGEAMPAPSAPKKKKKQSPSDIRRNLRKKAELEQRMVQNAQLPPAPPFPGIPTLMSMSFSGPGNTPSPPAPRNARTAAGVSAFSGTRAPGNAAQKRTGTTASGVKGTSTSESDDAGDFGMVPIPQMVEGPYPPASDYYAPGTPNAPGTSQKPRTPGYYRRRGARMSVYLTHLWGGDIEAAGKALARSLLPEGKKPPLIMPSSKMLSVTPLTEAQLRQLRKKVQEHVSMDDMRRAEEYWQRKRKEREAAGLSMVSEQAQAAMEAEEMGEDTSTEKPSAKMKRDRQRMTEYNIKKTAMSKAAAQGNADAEAGNNQASAATETSSPGRQRNQGASSQAGHWDILQASSHKPAAQPKPFRAPVPQPSQAPGLRFRVPGPKPFRAPASQRSRAPAPYRSRAPAPYPSRSPAPQPSRAPAPQPIRAPVPQPSRGPAPQPFRGPAPKTSSQTWNQFSSSQDKSLMPPPPPPPTLPPPPSPKPSPSTQSRFFQPPDQRPAQPAQNRFSHPPSSTDDQTPWPAKSPNPPQGPYSQHTRPPRPTSAPQKTWNTQPESSGKPGSLWGSASRPPAAQVGQNWHQQGSTSRWDEESQQQQQPWRREPGGPPRSSSSNAGGQSYDPYTPQQYEGFWQRGGVLKDGRENTDNSATHNQYYGQQYH